MNKLTFFLLLILLFSFFISAYLWFYYPQQIENHFELNLFSTDNVPVFRHSVLAYENLDLSATAVYALDLDSMTVLYEKNSQEVRYPASTSKMMTALVALDSFDLERELPINGEATVSGNKLELKTGQKIKVKDLLAAMLIFSANDSAYVLADNDEFGFASFMQKMNQKVSDLGLSQTHFVNPAGLDEDGQQSSARDLTLIARELLKNDYLRQLVATPYQKIEGPNWSYDLYNSNQLLGQIQGVAGVKTGTTQLAGQVLVTLVERDNHRILLTLMNSQDRYVDTTKLIAWILNNYEWKNL